MGELKTTGGRAWRHHASVRMTFAKGTCIDDKGNSVSESAENPCGNQVLVSIVKSKIFPANRKTSFYTLNYRTGIDYISDTIDIAAKEGVVSMVGGGWYSILNSENKDEVLNDDNGKPLKFQGKANFKNFLQSESKWFDYITKQLNDSFVNKI